MLYTVIYKKKLIVEADNSDEAEELAENGDCIVEEQELFAIRPTTQSERIWYDLPLKKETDYEN